MELTNNDQQLAQAARQGDQQAFSALANKYKPLLIRFLLPYTHILEDAEDLSQEALQRAFHNLDQYDPRYAFSTWLFNIARNAAIDLHRKQNNSLSVIPPNWHAFENGDLEESPEDTYIRKQTRKNLQNAIQSLPELYRKTAELRFIKDFAYEEIANQLQLPLNTVRTRLRRARELLVQTIITPNDPNL